MEYFKGQKYTKLKKRAIQTGELFVDPEFPPVGKSIYFSKVDTEIQWKRPKELCKVPKLIVNDATCDDMSEGLLGNTWFVSACCALTTIPRLFEKVIPNIATQDMGDKGNYGGIFVFRFWRFGRWVEVVVDDLLPSKKNKLIFCHSRSENEFWAALIEKAYAKLYGDYETLMTGRAADALVDFTGGLPENIAYKDLHFEDADNQEKHFKDLLDASENKALIISTVNCNAKENGTLRPDGIVKGYGYVVTCVRDVIVNKVLRASLSSDKLHLIRMNSSIAHDNITKAMLKSDEWKTLSLKERDGLGLQFTNEGEFWMCFEDYLRVFDTVDICHFINTSMFSLKKNWCELLFHNEWTVGTPGNTDNRAGGFEPKDKGYLHNPQLMFNITPVKGDTFSVCLEQHDSGKTKQSGQGLHQIGFVVMKVEENRKYRLQNPGVKVFLTKFTRKRSIFERITVSKGRYVIIPGTREPGRTGKFLMRMYSTADIAAKELVLDVPPPNCCSCFGGGEVKFCTRLTLIRGMGMRSINSPSKAPSIQVIVKCEGESYKTGYCEQSFTPEWSCKLLFYRKSESKPIILEVYNSKLVMDEFIGVGKVNELSDTVEEVEVNLFGANKESHVEKPGTLVIEVVSSYLLTDF